MNSREIFIVEDDAAVRQTLTIVLTAAGYDAICFLDGEALLAGTHERYPLCILLDIQLPGKSGLEILRQLRHENYPSPILMISGHATVASAVYAMSNGALDVIEKPFGGHELVNRIEDAIQRNLSDQSAKLATALSLNLPGRLPLSNREQQILYQLLFGKSTKQIALLLGLSPRTVEDHRSAIKRKTQTKTLVELIRIALGSRHFDALVESIANPESDDAEKHSELRLSPPLRQ
jgi:FixJ family two-component response regulator